jgi:hypothetical protein
MKRLQSILTWPPEIIRTLTHVCVVQAIEALPAFPTTINAQPYSLQEPDTDSIMEAIRICVETGNTHLCIRIAGRMREAACYAKFPPRLSPWMFYSRLAASLDEYLRAAGAGTTPGDTTSFFSDTVDSMLGAAKDGEFDKCCMTPQNFRIINVAIRRAGGIPFLKQR